jgi:hypothetical protein
MRQRIYALSTSLTMGASAGEVERQDLVGALSPSGHSMSTHSSSCGCERQESR